ncbi:hypothetical protein VL15_27550 [Burkholderia cepacia]|uniref:PapC-like C-terminal domain-containing protein n=1 Tax=Burkholderia cepacia TaxID=292 RepID=A0A0J5WJ61_BURCE|nr:FimD/PapC C-terminal domain-containing protein [Burkholderia cepacia]KML49998.1 hypothetical protein VL15_27550 [Burkholderia cepacia]
MQFELSTDGGAKVPFGAQAYDAKGKPLCMVDCQSRQLVFGIEDQGCIDVCWEGGSYKANYWLQQQNQALSSERVPLTCRQPSGTGDKLRRAAIFFPDEAGRTAARPRMPTHVGKPENTQSTMDTEK